MSWEWWNGCNSSTVRQRCLAIDADAGHAPPRDQHRGAQCAPSSPGTSASTSPPPARGRRDRPGNAAGGRPHDRVCRRLRVQHGQRAGRVGDRGGPGRRGRPRRAGRPPRRAAPRRGLRRGALPQPGARDVVLHRSRAPRRRPLVLASRRSVRRLRREPGGPGGCRCPPRRLSVAAAGPRRRRRTRPPRAARPRAFERPAHLGRPGRGRRDRRSRRDRLDRSARADVRPDRRVHAEHRRSAVRAVVGRDRRRDRRRRARRVGDRPRCRRGRPVGGKPGSFLAVADEDRLRRVPGALSLHAPAWSGYRGWVPAAPVDVVRTTNGAGDAHSAGFLAALLRGADPGTAARCAAEAARARIQGLPIRESIPQ